MDKWKYIFIVQFNFLRILNIKLHYISDKISEEIICNVSTTLMKSFTKV